MSHANTSQCSRALSVLCSWHALQRARLSKACVLSQMLGPQYVLQAQRNQQAAGAGILRCENSKACDIAKRSASHHHSCCSKVSRVQGKCSLLFTCCSKCQIKVHCERMKRIPPVLATLNLTPIPSTSQASAVERYYASIKSIAPKSANSVCIAVCGAAARAFPL